jgi:hypothetical protein
MEWKVGNISMLRKEAKLGEKKIGLSVIGTGGVKTQSMFLRHATHHPLPCPCPFLSLVCDLTLPKENSKENQFILERQI